MYSEGDSVDSGDPVDSCPHCGFVGVICPEHERMGRVPVGEGGEGGERVVCRLPVSELMVPVDLVRRESDFGEGRE